jgi:diadenosine tetraphosphate (Ap4A) HIT family hydrolase
MEFQTNDTIKNFGYPKTLLKEYDHWVVLIRPGQITLGSLILAAKSDVTQFSHLDPDAFAELRHITGKIETALGATFAPKKYNYLMLMMVDPHVHFHVLPRYDSTQSLNGIEIPDVGWPGPPALGEFVSLDDDLLKAIKNQLAAKL